LDGPVAPPAVALLVSLSGRASVCGSPTLDPLGASEIKAIAQLRSVGNALLIPSLRGPAVGALVGAVALVVLTSGVSDDSAIATVRDALRPLLGTVLAGSFLFTAYAAARVN
jgi:hypothetical protein